MAEIDDMVPEATASDIGWRFGGSSALRGTAQV
jgi:hypothetical protein